MDELLNQMLLSLVFGACPNAVEYFPPAKARAFSTQYRDEWREPFLSAGDFEMARLQLLAQDLRRIKEYDERMLQQYRNRIQNACFQKERTYPEARTRRLKG